MKYLLSLLATFMIFAYLGIWGLNLIKQDEPPPMSQLEAVDPPAQSQVMESVNLETAKKIKAATLSAFETQPGELLVLTLQNFPQPQNVKIDNPFGDKPQVVSIGESMTALIPIKSSLPAGEYTLTVSEGDYSEDFLVTVKPKTFPVQNIVVDPSVTQRTINSQAANDEYFQKVQPLKTKFEPEILWEGVFIKPTENCRVSSEFGEIRTVNGVESDRHGGVDFACDKGTPVLASNSGKVMFAQNIALTGNTVMIEHGLGLKTWYYHMDSIDVKEGDMVKQGQQIGTVGETGFATGPHLHFAASVGKTYINPWTLFEQEIKP